MDLFNIGNERASLFLMPLVRCCRSSGGKGGTWGRGGKAGEAVSGAPPPGGNDSRAERAQLSVVHAGSPGAWPMTHVSPSGLWSVVLNEVLRCCCRRRHWRGSGNQGPYP